MSIFSKPSLAAPPKKFGVGEPEVAVIKKRNKRGSVRKNRPQNRRENEGGWVWGGGGGVGGKVVDILARYRFLSPGFLLGDLPNWT